MHRSSTAGIDFYNYSTEKTAHEPGGSVVGGGVNGSEGREREGLSHTINN